MRAKADRAPSLKLNAMANYVGQLFSIVIGIVFVPFYLMYLGAEAYGLVGFFIVLQTWFGLLDIGLSPILNREVAKARAKSHDFVPFRRLLRTVEIIFISMAVLLAAGMWLFSEVIANHWFKLETLSVKEVSYCVALMGAIGGFRLFSSIYRSGFGGMEAQIPLNAINITFSLVKALGSLAVLHFVSTDPLVFFVFQFAVGLLEPVLLGVVFYRMLPETKDRIGVKFYKNELTPTLPFGLSIAYNTAIWITLTQLDKFILSGTLSLKDFGFMTLVTSLTTAVLMMTGPIGNALVPRLTYLISANKQDDMLRLYKISSQLMTVLMVSLTGMIALFSKELLFAWSGNLEAAQWGAPVLMWYMLGGLLSSMLAYPFMLQYAAGNMRLQVQMNTIRFVVYIPVIILAIHQFGSVGAAFVWFAMQLVSCLIWPRLVHNQFDTNLHAVWFRESILPILVAGGFGVLLICLLPLPDLTLLSRIEIFIVLTALGILELLIASIGSRFVRELVNVQLKKAFR